MEKYSHNLKKQGRILQVMYTGLQKKAVVMKPGANSVIEEAYFILKDSYSAPKESEMIREPNKILKDNFLGGYFFDSPEAQKSKEKSTLNAFLLGALLSFVLCTALFLLIK